MKFSIQKPLLVRALSHIQSVVEKRNTIPILSNVLVEAKDGRVSLTATDLDVEVIETIEAEVSLEGGTTLPAHTFYDIVRKLPDDKPVTLEYNDEQDRVDLSCGRSKFKLPCLSKIDFPLMSSVSAQHHFEIEPTQLKNALDRTRFAISLEETRYYLNGIFFHVALEQGQQRLYAVATDGHRLARTYLDAPEGSVGMPGVIVPRKTVLEIRKIIDDVKTPVKISVSETKIVFNLGVVILTSKLIDGTFPNYQNVIPAHNNRTLLVNTKDFIAAVDRVATVSQDKTRVIKLNLSENSIMLDVQSDELGSASETIEALYEDEPLTLGMNVRYLLEIANQIKTDRISFRLGDQNSPLIISEEGDVASLYVLMPMRV